MSKSLRDWDNKLSCIEFSYNRCPSYATSNSPFKVFYGLNYPTLLDLIHIPHESKVTFEVEKRGKEMEKLHEQGGLKLRR